MDRKGRYIREPGVAIGAGGDFMHRYPTPGRLALALFVACGWTSAAVLPDGFQETVVFQGLLAPTAVRFAPDGRVFIAEKSGKVKVFSAVGDPSPDLLIDLGSYVHNYWDRGLLGLAIDPDFPVKPYVYVLYTFNASPFEDPDVPLWPDFCPDPPGGTLDGCLVDGRLSRLEVAQDNTLVGTETVLLENRWCQQYPSHSIGDLVFDDHERTLFATAGDGASFEFVDYGQGGGSAGSPTASNPCDDPPAGAGGNQSPPTAQGGALRSQDLRTPGDPVSFDGALLAIDPDTGGPASENPLIGGDPSDDHIIAYGLRNPFRMTFRRNTHEIWIGDVGWSNWEEINRVADFEDPTVENFGWPCYEGPGKQPGYDGQNLALCESLYSDLLDPATPPFYTYQHGWPVDAASGEIVCSNQDSSSIAGIAFNTGSVYPAAYQDALFFTDFSRQCMFVVLADGQGEPDPNTRRTFADQLSGPVDLQLGPDGLLYYVDFWGGNVLRIEYFPDNQPPQASATATPSDGPLDLFVQFDASGSTDADEDDTLSYSWDLDGDGTFGDSDLVAPTWTFTTAEQVSVRLRVSDDEGASDSATVVVTPGNTSPVPVILTPAPGTLWKVGELIEFEGTAGDAEDGALPETALEWEIVLHHCPGGPTDCHQHPVQQLDGLFAGEFTAPDHAWYSFLEIRLTATDFGFPGLGSPGQLSAQTSRILEPRTVELAFDSTPSGLTLAVGSQAEVTPFQRTVIEGSVNSLGAISPQDLGGNEYAFVDWSDGGAVAHDVTAPPSDVAYLAAYDYAGAASNWWDAVWRSRIRITFDNSDQFDHLEDFPVLVTLDPSRIDYARTRDAGEDLRFVDEDTTTLLPHQIERWDEGGTSLVWVRVPKIVALSSTDHIWLYYDNPDAPDTQAAEMVWDEGFVGVWHLNDDLDDSTLFENHGTNDGSTDVAGKIADAQYFDGSAAIDAGNDESLAIVVRLSVEAWIRIDDPELDDFMTILSKKLETFSLDGYQFEYGPLADTGVIFGSGPDAGQAEGVDLDTDWHHVAATIAPFSCRLYVDGEDLTTDPLCNRLSAGSLPLTIGRNSGGGFFAGAIDELRLSATVRTGDWIRGSYRSVEGSLASYGEPESNCGPLDSICDGFDNDCDGVADEDPPASIRGVALQPSELGWFPVSGATSYDVVRGTIATLAGGYASSVDACLANDEPSTTLALGEDPPTGQGYWFLVRGVNCAGPGTYDSGAAGQQAARDAGIAASATACP